MFIEPKEQVELQGQSGLTSYDIADATGWTHKWVRRQLLDDDYWKRLKSLGLNISLISRKIQSGAGRPTKFFVMDDMAAEVFCAQTRKDEGVKYAMALVQFRRKAQPIIAQLQNRIFELECKLADTQKDVKQIKRSYKIPVVKQRFYQQDMFTGEMTEFVVKGKKEYDTSTEEERADWEISKRRITGYTHLKKADELEKKQLNIPTAKEIEEKDNVRYLKPITPSV